MLQTKIATAFCRLAKALVYGKVRAALGIRQGVVSGGGSLAPHLDDFYEAIGLPVINGWGLTVNTNPCRRVRTRMHGGKRSWLGLVQNGQEA